METITNDAVETAITHVEDAARALGDAQAKEMRLEDERPLVKRDAIKRLIESGAATSATAAEKIVEQDEEYAALRLQQRAAVMETQRAWGAWEAAKLRGQRAVAMAAVVTLTPAWVDVHRAGA